MLHLRRVRLESVGHPNARFAPLELRLLGDDGRPTHTVLWLRNGGGKSSLLNLLFAVVRPDRREFLGGNDDGRDRRLGDYVLAGDTAHVVLEWGVAGQRQPALVTGMVLEWRDRVRTTDDSRLRRLWYAFVPADHRPPGMFEPSAGLTMDTLPVVADGRRLTLARFRERLRAAAADPALRLATPTSQSEWRRELEGHDLDPEVLRYQLQMNREEGGASELFKRRCRTDAEFVDMLLELAVADERSERVAAVYTGYADQLARRPDVERHRDFLAGTLERLGPLTAALRQRAAAQAQLASVVSAADAYRTALGTAATDAHDRAADAVAAARERRDAAADQERRSQEHTAQAAALRRVAAALEVADAQAVLAAADAVLAAARAHAAAAAVLEPLARRGHITAAITGLDAADDGATSAPLAAARAQLADLLARDEREARAAADSEREQGNAATRAAERAAAQSRALTTERGRLTQARDNSAVQQRRRHERRAALIAQGVLTEAVAPPTALARAHAALTSHRARRAERRQRLAEVDAALTRAGVAADHAGEQATVAGAALVAAEHDQQMASEVAEALRTDQRLIALVETAAFDLWAIADDLIARLDQRVAEGDRRLTDAAVADAEERAALVALERDGLLPARRAARTVVAHLEAAGIPAVVGWRHLADAVPPGARADVLAAAPSLVDGVVITAAAALPAARSVLAALDEPVRSVVVVGPAPAAVDNDDAERPEDEPAPDTMVAPIDAALYDRATAEQTRDRLRARLEAGNQSRTAVTRDRDRDAALADRLRRLVAIWPEDRRAAVATRLGVARRTAEDTAARAVACRDEAERVRETREHLLTARSEDAEHEAGLTHAVVQLEQLTDDAEPADDDRVADIDRQIADVEHRAAAAESRVDAHRAAAHQHERAAERYDGDARRLREQRAALGVVTPQDVSGQHDADRPDHDRPDVSDARDGLRGDGGGSTSVEQLRSLVRSLQANAADGSGDAVARDRRAQLIEQRTAVERVLARHDDTAVRDAAVLLDTPQGRSEDARAATSRDAERARDRATHDRARAAERVSAASAELAGHPVVGTAALDPEPTTVAAAVQGVADGVAAAHEARAGAGQLRAEADDHAGRATRHSRDGDAFGHLVDLLTVELRDRPPTTGVDRGSGGRAGALGSVDGATVDATVVDVEQARVAVVDLQTRLIERRDTEQQAVRGVTRTSGDLRRFVADARFAALDGPIRSRLAADPVAVVSTDATVVDDLTVRLQQCSQTLTELTAHRRLLVREIAADVQRALWLLRQADAVSALPDGFGQWSQQRFLHIRFATPTVDDELISRLEAMVDELVDRGIRPAGVPLLQRATHAAVVGGFRVRILKPGPALRPDRVAVTDLATFSGGEQLTAAILLYCTLARLRAQARSAHGPAGLLTLDNPIGKSSNVTLLRLQRRVADAMGVQLVYTTAVDDREALGVLPHWIRLRNDRSDARTGNQHVEAALTDGDRDHTYVTAARLWRRGVAMQDAAGPDGGAHDDHGDRRTDAAPRAR